MIADGHEGKASAYGDKKWRVCRIPKGAIVFLYHVGEGGGVIARGTAISGFQQTEDKTEFYVPLKFDWALQEDQWRKAPKAREINRRLQTGHKFRPPVWEIGRRMADAIDSIAKEEGVTVGRSSGA